MIVNTTHCDNDRKYNVFILTWGVLRGQQVLPNLLSEIFEITKILKSEINLRTVP